MWEQKHQYRCTFQVQYLQVRNIDSKHWAFIRIEINLFSEIDIKSYQIFIAEIVWRNGAVVIPCTCPHRGECGDTGLRTWNLIGKIEERMQKNIDPLKLTENYHSWMDLYFFANRLNFEVHFLDDGCVSGHNIVTVG